MGKKLKLFEDDDDEGDVLTHMTGKHAQDNRKF
jgi:hypothetical protein